MQAFVYRSPRKADTYVFLRDRDAFEVLPEALRQQFGALQFVLQVELTPQRTLAREDPEVVRRNLAERGFHVQFPPPDAAVWEAGVEHE